MRKADVKVGVEHSYSNNASRKWSSGHRNATIVIPRTWTRSSSHDPEFVQNATGTYNAKVGWLCDVVFEKSDRTRVLFTGSMEEKREKRKAKVFVESRHLVGLAVTDEVRVQVAHLVEEAMAGENMKAKWAKAYETHQRFLREWSRRGKSRHYAAAKLNQHSDGWNVLVLGSGYREPLGEDQIEALEDTVMDYGFGGHVCTGQLLDDGMPDEWSAWQVAAAWGKVAGEFNGAGQAPATLGEVLAFAGAGFQIHSFQIDDHVVAEVYLTSLLEILTETD